MCYFEYQDKNRSDETNKRNPESNERTSITVLTVFFHSITPLYYMDHQIENVKENVEWKNQWNQLATMTATKWSTRTTSPRGTGAGPNADAHSTEQPRPLQSRLYCFLSSWDANGWRDFRCGQALSRMPYVRKGVERITGRKE